MASTPLGHRVTVFAKTALSEAKTAGDVHRVAFTAARMAAEDADRRADQLDREVDCRPGCTHCCHIRVEATPVEVLALAHALTRDRNPAARVAVQDRVRAADKITHALDERSHSASGVACPVLVDGRCSAYEDRPLDCQGYESQDEAVCRVLRGRYDFDAVPLNKVRYADFLKAREGLLTASRHLGREAAVLELTGALRIALEAPDTLARWLAGGRPFAAVRFDR